MQVVEAVSGDLKQVLEFRGRKAPAALPIRGATSEIRLEILLESYTRYWKWVGVDPSFRVYLAHQELAGGAKDLVGIILVVVGHTDSITDQPQGLIVDFHCESPEAAHLLFDLGEAFCRQHNMWFLVGDLSVDDTAWEDFLHQRGYSPDLNRIILPTSPPIRSRNRCEIRPACATDYFFVISLNSLVNSNTIPPGRGVDPNLVARSYLQAYSEFKIGEDPKMPTYIAEKDEQPIGYLMIKLSPPDPHGVQAGYIYELAVHPDHWGRRVGDELLSAATKDLAAKGVSYITGDVSQSNMRALKTAQKQLGFQLEARRWALDLRHNPEIPS
jgi:ribosomal protein S18 acetylase RimI-like enzyme